MSWKKHPALKIASVFYYEFLILNIEFVYGADDDHQWRASPQMMMNWVRLY
jgi:hypothetical protein